MRSPGDATREELAPAAAQTTPVDEHASELAPGVDLGQAPRAELVDAPVEAVAETTTTPDGLAEVVGRFLLPGGAPARGVEVELGQWNVDTQRAREFGAARDWQPPAPVLSDADGHFVVRCDPPRAWQFLLEARLAGFARAAWRWEELLRGARVDVGTITLEEEGIVLVSVVDADGEPTRGIPWSVYLSSDAPAAEPDHGRSLVWIWAEGVDGEGRYRIGGVPSGPARVSAASALVPQFDGPLVDVRAGEVVETTLRYTGPDVSRRVLLCLSTRPLDALAWTVEGARLVHADGEELRAPWSSEDRGFLFEDVRPGPWSARVDDPRFETWAEEGVEPGARVNAKLRGSSAIALTVLDAATGAALEPYVLEVELDLAGRPMSRHPLRAMDADAPPGAVYVLAAAPVRLFVHAPDHCDAELALTDLAPGETRAVVARLAPALRVSGRLRLALDDLPLADQTVYLLPPGSPPLATMAHRHIRVTRPPGEPTPPEETPAAFVYEATTDAAGAFAFERVPAGDYALVAKVGEWLEARVDPLRVAEEVTDVELVARGAAMVRGRLLVPPDAPLAALALQATSDTPSPWWPTVVPGLLPLTLDAEGTFTGGPFHAGELRLRLRSAPGPRGRRGALGPGFDLDLGALELVADAWNEPVLDLRERWPGSARVTVRGDGRPSMGVLVELKALDGPRVFGTATTDAAGVAHFPAVVSGDYRVFLAKGWRWDSGRELRVAGDEAALEVEYALQRGTLTLLDDADGSPLAERHASIYCADATGSFDRFTADAAGRLELVMPPGSYRVSVARDDGTHTEAREVEWAATGPVPDVLRIAGLRAPR
ncbi:MAG: hypothetical protein H6828_13270 [Planctomycetes bacterium]|nr:hypothetical protein [Planctomycetota bacterium]